MMLSKLLKKILLLYVLFMPVVSWAAMIINLGQGDARSLSFRTNISTVFVADSEVADYQVIDNTKLVIFGRGIGQTSLIVFGENNNTLANRKIVVNTSLTSVEQLINVKYPNLDIDVSNLGEQVVLSGKVPSQKEKNDIYRMVGEMLGKKYQEHRMNWRTSDNEKIDIDFMARRTYDGLVNNIEVTVTKQVNVKLTIAEVTSSFIDKLGVKWGSIFEGGFAGNGQFIEPRVGIKNGPFNIAAYISAVNDDSVGQVLSEPNLSVISGETASFLVGGEIPIVYRVDDGYRIEYKEYGIGLDLAAEVLADDKIKLSIVPKVSALDEHQYSNELLDIPSFKVRRARTTFELGDGQSFILGGLLNSDDQEALSKIPFIGDVPILGSLFRYTETERRKTELIIIANVTLVEPIEQSLVKLPTMRKTTTLSRFFGVKPEPSMEVEQWRNEILQTGGFKK